MALQTRHVPDAHAPSSDAWSPLRRIVLGTCLGYSLQVWVPWNIGNLLQVDWPLTAFQRLGRWTIINVLGLPEHFVPSIWASNNLTNYAAAAAAAMLAAIGSIAWVLLDRRPRTYSRLFAWLHTVVRYLLAAEMLFYGWDKVLPGQFGRMTYGAGTDYLVHQVGQLSPRDLMWAFMEASRTYQVFAGALEMTSGALLLARASVPVGAALAIASLVNVLMLDIGYDVAVKFFAGQLLLMAVLVVAPYLSVFKQVLRDLRNRSRDCVCALWPAHGQERMTRLVGVFVGIVVILFTLRGAQAIVADNRATASTPLHGIWDVETVERNGKRVALTIDDDRLWRRLVFPFRGTKSSAILVWMSDAVTRYRSAIDADAAIIELDPIAGNTVSGSTRGRPSAAALVRQVFSFSQPDPDHLMLEGRAPDGTALLIRLRKFDPEAYLLISHRPQWRW